MQWQYGMDGYGAEIQRGQRKSVAWVGVWGIIPHFPAPPPQKET